MRNLPPSFFNPSKKTMHSALFFALLLLGSLVWITVFPMAVLLAGFALMGLNLDVGLEQMTHHLALLMLGVVLLLLLFMGPLVGTWMWANARITLRVRRIMAGKGWGGWVPAPTAPDPLAARQQADLRERRRKLRWQLPLIVAVAALVAILGDAALWFGIEYTVASGAAGPEEPAWLMVGYMLVSLVVLTSLLVFPSARLLQRAWPGIKAQTADIHFSWLAMCWIAWRS